MQIVATIPSFLGSYTFVFGKGTLELIMIMTHLQSSLYLADSRKHFDDSGDHEDDPPPASGSQAFQQIC